MMLSLVISTPLCALALHFLKTVSFTGSERLNLLLFKKDFLQVADGWSRLAAVSAASFCLRGVCLLPGVVLCSCL